MLYFFFFKQKTAYEMRISDWSSDVCSSDLAAGPQPLLAVAAAVAAAGQEATGLRPNLDFGLATDRKSVVEGKSVSVRVDLGGRRIIKQKTEITIHINPSLLNNTTIPERNSKSTEHNTTRLTHIIHIQ